MVVAGVPDTYELQEGDICNIDVTVYVDFVPGSPHVTRIIESEAP